MNEWKTGFLKVNTLTDRLAKNITKTFQMNVVSINNN